ncbi:MAG: SGNH/GDSL hydrolase family protein [Kiritimatiellae bacterium]|nr:SGNH/GDSL hydrolase family protein [Kiritimatiellia bacterium]MDD5520835.1 SGNH/GDSL hydrolase family protein [Kiritimatiellia bacterium]
MFSRIIVLVGIITLFSLNTIVTAADTASAPVLKKDDRIVFLGDSITAGGSKPDGYITLIKNSINAAYKDLCIETINSGISGNKVPNLQARLEKDVLSKKPTIVFIYIGINDVWHWKKDKDGILVGGTPTDKYEAGLKEIIGKIKDAGARVILCTATVIGEKNDGTNERDKMLEEYCDISRKVALETKTEMVDLRKVFIDYLKTNNKENNSKGVLTRDTVHLNPQGNKVVAEEMLKVLGVKLVEIPVQPVQTAK